jgi:hypothetical protein
LWLVAYPLPNSLDDGVVVRKLHALQVWSCGYSPRALCSLWSTYTTQTHRSMTDTLPHTVVGVCGEFQRTGATVSWLHYHVSGGRAHWTSMTSRTAYSTSTPQKPTHLDGHYLRNRSTLDIGVLGYIGIV